MDAIESYYSLKWDDHQNHILTAFDALLKAETLVDATLVCADSSVRAHKVVLSACSPFFQTIFSDNPCKHPVIVLKDFNSWEVQAIIDFMYKGEISVCGDQLESLINAAENLQIRGLGRSTDVHQKQNNQNNSSQSPASSSSSNHFERNFKETEFLVPDITITTERSSPLSPLSSQYNCSTNNIKYPIPFPESFIPKQDRNDFQYSIPRKKATPKRLWAGGVCKVQNITTLQKPQSPTEETAKTLLKEGHLPFSSLPNISPLAMGQPHDNLFTLNESPGLSSPGLDGCGYSLFETADSRTSELPNTKKKRGRPRSWTDADLSEAIQYVLDRKMNAMGAARIFGIPYSTLMTYAREGWNGTKVQQPRGDYIAAQGYQISMTNISENNNTNFLRNDLEHNILQPNSTEGLTIEQISQQSMLAGMTNVLPQNEKNRKYYRSQATDEGNKDIKVKDEMQNVFMFSSTSQENR